MKKKLIVALMSMTLLLTACGGKEEYKNQANNQNEKNVNVEEKSDKDIKIGIVQFSDHIALDRSREGFISQLEDEGFNVDADVVNCQGDISLIPTAAKKFESDKVDVIYAIATPAAQGMKNAIKDIPIIFNAVTDPVETDLVKSKESPEANVTGVSDYFPLETQIDKFLEAFPESKTLGLLYSTGEANSEGQIKELKEIVKNKGMNLEVVGVNSTNDVPQAMSSLTGKIDSYVAIQDNLASSSATVISQSLIKAQIPSFAGEEGPVENGMLLSDGVDYIELGKEAGKMASEIKKGKEVKDIPVFFSKDAKRTVNGKTAEALNIEKDSKIFENAKVVE